MRRGRVSGYQAVPARLFGYWLGAVLAAITCISPAFAAVNLITTNPPAAPAGTQVALGGAGFPSGTIPAANVSVTITPASGGPAVITTAGAVLGTGLARLVVFTVPASLAVDSPMNCSVTVGGSSGSGVPFATSTAGVLVIQPAASVRSVSPGAARAGSTVTVQVGGGNTHFTTNTVLALSMGALTIRQAGAVALADETHVSAVFDIPNEASAGPYTLTAATGSEIAALPGALLIASVAPVALSSVAPNSLAAGQAATVSVAAVGTHFVQATTVARLGDGVVAGPVTVLDATHATIPIAIDPLAGPGPRTLTLFTGQEYAAGAFTIASSSAALTRVGRTLPTPVCATGCSGRQGTDATLTLEGTGTHWVQGVTTVTIGGGIAVTGVRVASPTSLAADVSIGLGVPAGNYSVTAITAGEVVSLADAFAVIPAAPYLSWVYPNAAAQGQMLDVRFTGVSTSFDVGALSAGFGPNVTVNSVSATAAYAATANITIGATAFTGARTGTLTSDGRNFGFTFTVTPSGAAVISATPTTPGIVHQGDSGDLISIVGSGTHFTAEGLTPSIVFCAGVTVAAQQVVDATHIVATINISADAPVGACGVSVTTDGEVAGGQSLFNIAAGAVDRTPVRVASVSPANHQQGVPLNARISLRLTRPAAPLTVNNSSVTLIPPVTGATVRLSADGMTISVVLGSTLLTAGRTYAISIAPGAFQDQNGNPVAAFASRFDAGAAVDATAGAITLASPAPGQQDVAPTHAITVAFSEPWDANSLTGDYFKVCRNQDCNSRIAGTLLPAVNNTMIFTPAAALPSNARIDIYVGCDSAIQDLAGNLFAPLNGAYFLTAAGVGFAAASLPEAARPRVVSVTPDNGAGGVGSNAPIAIGFNRPLDVDAINPANFALYNGPNAIKVNLSYSSDRTVVYLSTPGAEFALPYDATLTVAISPGVMDFEGNNMGTPCSAPLSSACTYSFSTRAEPLAPEPTVIQARPGDGAPVDVPITLHMSAPMNLPSVQANMFVTQSGTPVSGSASLASDGRAIVWTPSAGAFQAGALIEVRLKAPAADAGGITVTDYYRSYRTAAGRTASNLFAPVAFSPCHNCATSLNNPVIEVRFSNPVDALSLTTAAFNLTQPDNAQVLGTISFPSADLVRFTPSGSLASGQLYRRHVTRDIKDVFGNSLNRDSSFYFYVGSEIDTAPPTVQFATPSNAAVGVGIDSPIRVVFNEKMDTLSINSDTLALRSGIDLPYTATFGCIHCGEVSEQTVATLMPQVPLPAAAVVSVILNSGIADRSGNAIAAQTAMFQTMAGADLSLPSVVERSANDLSNTGAFKRE